MNIINKIKNYYNNSSIHKKLTLIFLLISVIPMCVIQIFNYAFNTNILNTYVNNTIYSSLKQAHSEIDLMLKMQYNVISSLSNDKDIIDKVSHINVWGAQYNLQQRELMQQLKKVVFGQNKILGIAIITRNGTIIYYDTVSMSVVDSFCFELDDIRQQSIITNAQNNPQEIYMEASAISKPEHDKKNVLYLSKSLLTYGYVSDASVGTLVLCVDESSFSDVYQTNQDDEFNLSFAVDQNGEIFSSNNSDILGKKILIQNDNITDNDIKMFVENLGYAKASDLAVTTYTATDSNYTVINVQYENYLLKKIYYKSVWIILLGIVSILITITIINYTSNNITDAVRLIINCTKQVNAGNLNVRIENSGKDEFAQISQNFNIMISKMKNLISREKNALERKRNAEIKALESQINPHFLYNTLDSINWMAIENQQFDISKALKYLAIILRYNISNSNEIVQLKQELEYLKKYIYLQQNRFRYSFLCMINMPSELENIKIHKMLMQPLIENSIEHAFPSETGQDIIKIDFSVETQGILKISISDNGIGISNELIKELNDFDYESDDIKSKIGIRNVLSRIKIYYKDDGGYKIYKNNDYGTTIELYIPYSEQED